MHSNIQVLALCGALRGWLSNSEGSEPKGTLAEIRDKRCMYAVVRADVATTIGSSNGVYGWRSHVGDVDPPSAVL
jgi:hypothetical protein